MSAPEDFPHVFAQFLVRPGETRLDPEKEQVVLRIHAVTAERSAERAWLSISSNPHFVRGLMLDEEVDARFSLAIGNVLEVVAEFHVVHGIVDIAFNELATKHTVDAFNRRRASVASLGEERGHT